MTIAQTVVLVGAAAMGAWFVWKADPAWTLSLGLAASVFTSRWPRLGIPVPVDRILLVAAALMVVFRLGKARDRPRLKLGAVHILLFAVVVMAIASAFWAGTLGQHEVRFDILDRLGIVPFVLFALAPVVYYDPRRRGILLGVLVGLGFYLGLDAVFEGAKLNSLVWPRYILDPAYGFHADRARGPFLEAVSNGLALVGCGTAAVIALRLWTDRLARRVAWATVWLCLAGVVLTYTRSVWIAGVLGVLAAIVAFKDMRPRLAGTLGVGVAVGVIFILAVPGLEQHLAKRYNESGPVWVRQHTNAAALRMVAARPLTGFGWRTFQGESAEYFRDIPNIQLTGYNEDVHNVVLARAEEVGILGAGLWAFALIMAFAAPAFRRNVGDLALWQRGYVVVLLAEVVAAVLTPLGYPFQGMLVAVWAGLLLAPLGREQRVVG